MKKIILMNEAKEIIKEICEGYGIGFTDYGREIDMYTGTEKSEDVATFGVIYNMMMNESNEENASVYDISFNGRVRSMPSDMTSEDLREFANRCTVVANAIDDMNEELKDVLVKVEEV